MFASLAITVPLIQIFHDVQYPLGILDNFDPFVTIKNLSILEEPQIIILKQHLSWYLLKIFL